ncbi:MAG: L,D-transpeptidase family protein [Actinomycetota bacterium]
MRRRIVLVLVLVCLVASACVRPASRTATSQTASVTAEPIAPLVSQPLLPVDGTLVVRARASRLRVFEQPGPGAVRVTTLPAANDWAQPVWLPTIDGFVDADGTTWYQVRLPIRPNGTTGWVRARDVAGRTVFERIEVDLSEHRLVRIADGRTVASFQVGVGAPATPTASGRFFVWARVPSDPSGPYGVLALGLSGFSDVITDWVGGGRLAVHGTNDLTDRGADVSHGCVRVFNAQMSSLSDVSLGTPVWIHP